ncbi:hypothetical protein AAMO2058_000319000 [Amorphochlora amoebiformis]
MIRMKRRRRSSTKISHGGRGSKALARDLDAKYSIRYLPLDNNTLIYVLGYLNPDDLRKTASVCKRWNEVSRWPTKSHSMLWCMALRRAVAKRNYYKLLQPRVEGNEEGASDNELLPLSELGKYFRIYNGAGLKEAIYHVVDWPTQFDGKQLESNPEHPHHVISLESKTPEGFKSLRWERLAYRGSLERGDRAVRGDTPFPRVGVDDGLSEAFVMPYYLSEDERESLRMFPRIWKGHPTSGKNKKPSTSCPRVRDGSRRHPLDIFRRFSKRSKKINKPEVKSSVSSTEVALRDVTKGFQLVFSTIAYFEVQIEQNFDDEDMNKDGSCIAIGLARRSFLLTGKQPGWDSFSYGYHGDDGNIFHGSGMGEEFGSAFGPGDVVGCGIDYTNRSIFFTKNGAFLGVAFEDVLPGHYYPVVGVDTRCPFRVNFGINRPFEFMLLIYQQTQLKKNGFLSEYPKHPLLTALQKRMKANKPRPNSPSPRRRRSTRSQRLIRHDQIFFEEEETNHSQMETFLSFLNYIRQENHRG